MFTANHHKTIPSKYTPNILKKNVKLEIYFYSKGGCEIPKFKTRCKENVCVFLKNSNNDYWEKSCANPPKKLNRNSIY